MAMTSTVLINHSSLFVYTFFFVVVGIKAINKKEVKKETIIKTVNETIFFSSFHTCPSYLIEMTKLA